MSCHGFAEHESEGLVSWEGTRCVMDTVRSLKENDTVSFDHFGLTPAETAPINLCRDFKAIVVGRKNGRLEATQLEDTSTFHGHRDE
jgi:hypothetical protein